VVDGSGEVVARGRNRIFEESAPSGEIAGSFIAHAELNALGRLPARDGRPYEDHVLYTTLEPCALCVGAAMMVVVGGIRFASADHYGGGTALRLENPHTLRSPLVLEGPLDGGPGQLGELFHVAHFLWRKPEGVVISSHRERNPELVELAERLDLMGAARDGANFDDVVALVASGRA
jgi:Cytidine and deoxycytidylate deaminase zinc-binding region